MVAPVGAPSHGLPVASRAVCGTSMMVRDCQMRRNDPRRAHLICRRSRSADGRRRLAHLRVPFLDNGFELMGKPDTVALARTWRVRRYPVFTMVPSRYREKVHATSRASHRHASNNLSRTFLYCLCATCTALPPFLRPTRITCHMICLLYTSPSPRD